jgi:hypothetical protein
MSCLDCLVGWHFNCDNNPCCCEEEAPPVAENKRGGPAKIDDDVTDPKSTGRKRAAVMYPLEEGMICEWAGLANAGGGGKPIIGCYNNPATNRHHGPDKSTLNNAEGNVHRICAHCHNRWHASNDPIYIVAFGTKDWKIHDPESRADSKDIVMNEILWSGKVPTSVTSEVDH